MFSPEYKILIEKESEIRRREHEQRLKRLYRVVECSICQIQQLVSLDMKTIVS